MTRMSLTRQFARECRLKSAFDFWPRLRTQKWRKRLPIERGPFPWIHAAS
jgi:hypothetical protein